MVWLREMYRLVWLQRGFAVLGLLWLVGCGREVEVHPERVPIGVVQGRVTGEEEGVGHRSPKVGQTVVVRGVVHQVLRWRAGGGHGLYGALIQDLPGEGDGDRLSSDGLFVYAGGARNLRWEGQGHHALRVGDVLTLRGEVEEFYGQTQLANPVVLKAETGGDVDALLPARRLRLSRDVRESHRILERHEGMRVALSPGTTTVSGSVPNERNRDVRVWVTPSENRVLKRERAAERRLFRGAHPLGDVPRERWTEGSGMRVMLGSLGLMGAADEEGVGLPPMRTGTVFPDEVVGGIHYSFGAYTLHVEDVPRMRGGEDPAEWRIPAPEGREGRVRVATYNLENLYDFVDDPHRDCDFPGNPGCEGVRPPFRYVPMSDAEYRARLRILAGHIVEELGAPDILMVQEVENQDIGVLTDVGMVYGEEDDADGELDALQELAIKIVAVGGPVYTTAAHRGAGDNRGIATAFLYLAERFRPVPAEAGHPVLGASPEIGARGEGFPMVREVVNPKAFNYAFVDGMTENFREPGVFSRPVQVFGLREVGEVGEEGRTLWLLNNHFSAYPDRRVERRRAQARINALLAKRLMEAFPEDGVIVGGDLNFFPRPDDALEPPTDQLGALYEAGLYNVADWILEVDASNGYSYVYRGVAGTLDHLFLSPGLREEMVHASYVHLNADFAEGFRGEVPLRGSDHDPLYVDFGW